MNWAATLSHAHTGAPVLRGASPWPVLLYSPGAGDDRTFGTVMEENLASRGYVVVAIDHTYDASEVEFPSGRLADSVLPQRLKKAQQDGTVTQLLEKVLHVRVADTRFVLDELPALNAGRNPGAGSPPLPAGLAGALNLNEIGMVGVSGGGFTAAQSMYEDPRIKAGIDIDGTLEYTENATGKHLSTVAQQACEYGRTTAMTAARDRLARMLRGDAQTAFSVALTAGMDDLSLEVEGFGRARFGRGEQTLTDTEVRDTWEIPKCLVRAEWDGSALKSILMTVKEELGLPNAAELTADLHSLLVYETNQHFVAHQDSEKEDSMIGTLVVTLPSGYTGGELMVGHNEDWKAYRGSRTALSLVAFYADCRHEVLRVTSGYRITLPYNLLLHGATSRQEGDDARRVALLRTAANQADCETVLALADIKTTHSAFEDDDDDYGYRRHWDDGYDEDEYEYDDDGSGDDTQYEIQELIDSEVALTYWTGPDSTRGEEISLSVDGGEVCASTETGGLEPYSSQYEGYMGNWGNTLDRWYHRAAVVVWPHDQAFTNRAETSPVWALDELAAMALAGDVPGAQAAAATLAPFWDGAVRRRVPAEIGKAAGQLFGKALRATDAVADADTAAMLLQPFRIETLTGAHVNSIGTIACRYGQEWTAGRLRTWFGGDQPAWVYGGAPGRAQWVVEWLPGLCEGLQATGSAGAMAAQQLLDLVWKWAENEISTAIKSTRPSYRDRRLSDLGEPLTAVLTAATAIGAVSTRDSVSGCIRKQKQGAVAALEMSALRAATDLREAGARGDTGFGGLAADCVTRLRTRLARPERAPGDWSVELPADGCACELCGTLREFLKDASRRELEWPLAQKRRQHVHSRIDDAELPVTHRTRRQGRPYTLVLKKTDEIFTREQEARARDEEDLEWLVTEWHPGA